MVWDIQSFADISTNHHLIHELVSDGGVCRTAPAIPGLFLKNTLTIENVKRSLKIRKLN